MDELNKDDKYISMLSDYGFKVTFGNESDTRFLKKALQALIKSPFPITHVTFVQNEIKGVITDSRSVVYDLACIDENDNHFIVEMQLSDYPTFIHRMKYYALYRYNNLVKKGKYLFEELPKIYCIGILANNIFSEISDYHNISAIRNEKGELIDDQMTYITVELVKFDKKLNEIHTDLDKLIYTMKNLKTNSKPIQYPEFWTEEWIDVAIKELETRAMTADERFAFEMTVSRNAQAVYDEKRKIKAAEEKQKKELVKNMLLDKQLSIEKIAQYSNTTIDYVLDIQKSLIK